MKILQVFNQYRFRGGEEAWVDAIEPLLREAAEVRELRFKSSAWDGPEAPSKLQQALRIGDNPESRQALRECVEKWRPDLLLFHNVIPVGSMGLYDEARALGLPVLQYVHNFRPFSPSGTLWVGDRVNDAALGGNVWPEVFAGGWQGSRVKTALLAWHLKKALAGGLFGKIAHWVAPSDFMRERFVKAGVDASRMTVIPHCHRGGMREENEAEGDHYLYLGRLERDKGVPLLLEAWRAFREGKGSTGLSLKIAGTGSLEPDVREMVKGDASVEYLGHVSGMEKETLLAGSRAVLIPSICWESLGLTAYEAYAVGRPVVASRAGALSETVDGGKTGWVCDPGSVEGFARAMAEAEQAGPEERMRRGRNGAEWVKANASPERWRDQFLAMCEQVIGRMALKKTGTGAP